MIMELSVIVQNYGFWYLKFSDIIELCKKVKLKFLIERFLTI